MEKLLKWSIENSAPRDPNSEPPKRMSDLDANLLAQLMGAPDEAQLMKDAMYAIESPDVDLPNREIAFENLMTLVEGIDNANNLQNLGLWEPLLKQLDRDEKEMRMWAAWVCGCAVQNNPKTQEIFLKNGGLGKVAKMVSADDSKEVRLKAAYAVSSAIRNFENGLNEVLKHLPEAIHEGKTYDANNMEEIDGLMGKIRETAKQEK